MHIPCIEHFAIRAKLVDVIGFELIKVAERRTSSVVSMFALATETVETLRELERYTH